MTSDKLVAVKTPQDIPAAYRGTPIELLLKYQNFGEPHEKCQQPQMLIGMCIDYRKHLNTPQNFAYMIRTGGANFRYNEFKVSFAVAVGGVSCVALIGHTQCGMVNLESKKETFVQGLVDRAGWNHQQAKEHFEKFAPIHEIGDEAEFVLKEVTRLRALYPKILFVPLVYKVEDDLLYLVRE